MRRLSASLIISTWERGADLDPVGRTLLLLSLACPERQPSELALLSICERNTLLFDLRRKMFAGAPDGFAQCPNCSMAVEFQIPHDDLPHNENTQPKDALQFTQDGFSLRFRLPNTQDLAVAGASLDADRARRSVAHRCVLDASRNGASILAEDLPEPVISGLSKRLEEAAASTELLIDLSCPGCGHNWQVDFEIASYLWTEISALAKRILREVHILARAYGWPEADILAMPAVRRQFYLDMVA